MDREHLLQLYDAQYASTYDERFLFADCNRSDAEFEVELIRGLLPAGATWLDVACGTGWFLKHFPDVKRAGLDMSAAMLDRARAVNPNVPLFEGNFLDARPEWENAWSLVSCMWYAYNYVDTVRDVERLAENLACWTARDGTCLMPLSDPHLLAAVQIPYHVTNTPSRESSILQGSCGATSRMKARRRIPIWWSRRLSTCRKCSPLVPTCGDREIPAGDARLGEQASGVAGEPKALTLSRTFPQAV